MREFAARKPQVHQLEILTMIFATKRHEEVQSLHRSAYAKADHTPSINNQKTGN